MSLELEPQKGVAHLSKQFVDTFSVSGNEKELADAIEKCLREKSKHLEITRIGHSVIAKTNFSNAKKRIIIAGHLDTVPVSPTTNNVPGRFETDKETKIEYLWGRGSVDMKSSCAIALILALELTDAPINITYIWYECEEISSIKNGISIIKKENPNLLKGDFGFVCEPSNAGIGAGCKGSLRVKIILKGIAAHSAKGWVGNNAIHKLEPLLHAINSYNCTTDVYDGLEFIECLNVTKVKGGIASNIIPDRCEVEVNYRWTAKYNKEQALENFKKILPNWDFEILDNSSAAPPNLSNPFAKSFISLLEQENNNKPIEIVGMQGWTDVAGFYEIGVPAINFGAGSHTLSHTDNERCAIKQIEFVHYALKKWILEKSGAIQ